MEPEFVERIVLNLAVQIAIHPYTIMIFTGGLIVLGVLSKIILRKRSKDEKK